jgi:CDP-diacylglycerol--glycerol-3-phosphate 3-phosphatidyltransferase
VTSPDTPRPEEIAADRLVTIPNILSTLRLLGVPLFLYLVLGPHADGWALVILMISGLTDYLDGKLARLLNQTSKLGTLLDPLADRLYIASTLVALTIRGIVPVWLLVILVLRDVALLTTVPGLRRMGFGNALPVHFLGKAATFNLLYAFPLLLLSTGDNWLATAARPVGWAFAIWGTVLYWWAAVLYGVQYRRLVQDEREGRLPTPLPG